MPIDFALNYPCYSPMRSPEEPYTFTAGDAQCVVLATDADLLRRFFHQQQAGRVLIRNTFETPAALADFLHECAGKEKRGTAITHVLVDPVDPPRPARCYPIVEFARHAIAAE